MNRTIFAWDLGATKCTAGLVSYSPSSQELICQKNITVKLVEVESLEALIHNLEDGLGCKMSDTDAVCIGAAGQYNGTELLLENAYPYPMQFAKVAEQMNWPAYDVIHDYAPIVCSTFTNYIQHSDNIKKLNQYDMNPVGRRVALGIGTGLGLKDGVLFPNGDFWLGKNEIGHIGVTTPPYAEAKYLERHEEMVRFLQAKAVLEPNQCLTFEKILSGKGTVRLYQFFYGDDPISPESVGDKMRNGHASEMLDAFAWYAGLFVGTVQLSFMPEGGVWITGGVAIKNLAVFDRPDFFAGIDASPAYRQQREAYPLSVLCNEQHALIGCGYYASRRLMTNTHG